jgi:hypothetical protein
LHVQPCSQKYLSFHLTQITGLSRAIPFPIEGRFAIVTDVGFGMRWTRRCAGRSAPMRTAKPCGPDAPTLAFKLVMMPAHQAIDVARAHHTGDGGNEARSPRRARSKPLKPLRREGRIDPTSPVVTNSCAFYFAHEAAGAAGTRSSLRPPCSEARGSCITRTFLVARTRSRVLPR